MLRRPRLHFLHSVGKGPPGCPRITWFKTVQRNLNPTTAHWVANVDTTTEELETVSCCTPLVLFFCFTALFKHVYFDFQIQQDLKHHHLTLPEAADLAQNRPLWRMMSTYGATQCRNRELHARNDDDDFDFASSSSSSSFYFLHKFRTGRQ